MSSLAQDSLPEVIRLDRPVHYLGRGDNMDIRIAHPAVSRRHAELRWEGENLWVRNLSGHFGVLVNGVVVADSRLSQDDVVSFGPVTFEVKGRQLRRLKFSQGIQVETRSLLIQRGLLTILSSVNLTIPANNFVGILGPSGAGKTTLLKALSGSLPPQSGKVLLDGLDLSQDLETLRAMMGFVPQEDIVYPTLTARENLDYALSLRMIGDLRPDERHTWVEHLLKRLRLESLADRPVATLSGGERKRVNVGVELLTRPRLLLLDEPTSGLDPAAEAELMAFLRELAHRGTTVLCTTHVMESLTKFDDVMVVAAPVDEDGASLAGRLLGHGEPQKLLPHWKCDNFAQLYEKLKHLKLKDLPPPSAPTKTDNLSSLKHHQMAFKHNRPGTLHQIATQFARGARLILRDKPLLVLLIGQPLLVGLLINLSQITPGSDRGLNLLWTFATVVSIWLGLNNTAREVIRDRAVYVRERRTTVNPESYLLAKICLFGMIGFAQVLLLTLVLRYLNFLDPTLTISIKELHNKVWLMLPILWLTYLSAMFLGLLISTLAPSEEVAVAMLPLVILPQLLLTGVATNFEVPIKGGHFNSLAVLFSSQAYPARGFTGWLLELTSLFTYSRPALVFLLQFNRDDPTRTALAAVIDLSHLLFLLLLTATVLVVLFFRRDKLWMESS